jgi:hypothetical protein
MMKKGKVFTIEVHGSLGVEYFKTSALNERQAIKKFQKRNTQVDFMPLYPGEIYDIVVHKGIPKFAKHVINF